MRATLALDPDHVEQHGSPAQSFLRLWAEVMRVTLEDYYLGLKMGLNIPPLYDLPDLDHRTSYDRGVVHRFDMACCWLFSDSKRPRGFLWACDHLGVNPDSVRARLSQRSTYVNVRRLQREPKQSVNHARLDVMGNEPFRQIDVAAHLNLRKSAAAQQIKRWIAMNLVGQSGSYVSKGQIYPIYQRLDAHK